MVPREQQRDYPGTAAELQSNRGKSCPVTGHMRRSHAAVTSTVHTIADRIGESASTPSTLRGAANAAAQPTRPRAPAPQVASFALSISLPWRTIGSGTPAALRNSAVGRSEKREWNKQ